jgi:alpha-tubulin suppressor-like RCC1 family protein
MLIGTACDRSDPMVPTTPDRPARLTYAYARIDGSIVIREESYDGVILVTCADAAIPGTAKNGFYSLLLRLEVASGTTAVGCRLDVGQPVQTTQTFEATLVGRVDALQTQNVDVLVLPDAPALARMELPIKSVSTAATHTCAISATSAVYCWGLNKAAELGFGWHLPTVHPARVVWDQTATQVVAAGSNTWYSGTSYYSEAPRSCALRDDGAVYCWGDASVVDFDTTISRQDARFPHRVQNVPAFTRIVGGGKRPCGITVSEELYCWNPGSSFGDVGPGRVDLVGVVDVASSNEHRCALKRDGKWRCWGDREWGEFGDTTTAHTFKRIAAGEDFTCALDHDGFAYCWGRNNLGQLGRGATTAECLSSGGVISMCPGTDISPQRVATDVRFTQIDAGADYVCALAVNGVLYCWGEGAYGQLGNGTFTHRTTPVFVALNDPLRFTQFSVGEHHACGVATDGKLYCWGQGGYGQLGDGDKNDRSRPTAVWGQ